nr:unnamed protein product [Callosobruchus analis]
MVFTERQKTELKNVCKDISKEIVKEIILEKDFIDLLVEKLAVKVCDKMNDRINALTTRIDDLEKKLTYAHDEQEELRSKLEDVQQYTKRNQLRVYGFSECKNETLKRKIEEFFEDKLAIIDCGITECYRIRPASSKKLRPVLLIFKDSAHKNSVFLNKKQLKRTKVVITEELIKSRYDLYQYAREKIGPLNVWTMDGKIFTKYNNRKVQIRNEDDVLKITK